MASNQNNQGMGNSSQRQGGLKSSQEQQRDDQGQFAGTGGSQNREGSASSDRGFAGMDDQQQREAARRGGQTSANEQDRDDQGEFAGTRGSGQGGASNQGGSNR